MKGDEIIFIVKKFWVVPEFNKNLILPGFWTLIICNCLLLGDYIIKALYIILKYIKYPLQRNSGPYQNLNLQPWYLWIFGWIDVCVCECKLLKWREKTKRLFKCWLMDRQTDWQIRGFLV